MNVLLSRAGLPLIWASLTLVALWARPLTPIDETRYAGVAWEMWLRGDWLVPFINGAPYSHKPPLLFWLINLGWGLFGVHDWVPRLVTALVTLADAVLVGALARRLWPDEPRTAQWAPWAFYGCMSVVLFGTTLMFDLLMTFTVLLGLFGLLGAWRRDGAGNWLLYGLGIGLGLLGKGPAILIYLLPAALLAPWWMGERYRGGWRRWYRQVGLALLGGFGLALCWAIPAAIHGGAEYRGMILWGQTAGRVVKSFAHAHPLWWYLPVVPLILLPWSLWLPAWRALPALRGEFGAPGRFCLSWFLAGLLAFSLISGKQVHYLLPLLPALTLLVARLLTLRPAAGPASRLAVALVLSPFVLLGGVVLVAALVPPRSSWPEWIGALSPLAGLALIALALAWGLLLRRGDAGRWLAVLPAVFSALLYVGVFRVIVPFYQLEQVSDAIWVQQAQGHRVAVTTQFEDQYPFARHMSRPLELVADDRLQAWARANPRAVLVARHKRLSEEQRAAALVVEPFRRGYAVLWQAATLAAHPDYLDELASGLPVAAGDE